MEEQKTIDKLDQKVSEIITRYHSMKEETELLRNEIQTLKLQDEAKNLEIERLNEENSMKDLEIEEIISKIESIMG